MPTSLISIIVPVYKVEEYLPRCVESLLAQTYRNLDIILVDDGSPDRCPALCDSYAAKDARVRVLHTGNRGLSAARNAGLAVTRGDYVFFVDSDDWVAPDAVERMYAQIAREGADVCVCGIRDVYSLAEATPDGVDTCLFYGREEFMERILTDSNCYGYACNKLIRMSVLGELRFDENLFSCEDMVFCVELATACTKVVQLQAQLYYYFQRPSSMTGVSGYSERKLSVIRAYEMIAPFYEREAPQLMPIINRNYLKINLNVKGRMLNSHVEDASLMAMLNANIARTMRLVMASRSVSVPAKLNILLTWLMPGTLLKIKQRLFGMS